MVAEGFCLLIWTVYFVWISRNAFLFIYFTIGLNTIALIGCFYLVESPRYLFGMEKFDECRKVLKIIALRNGLKDYQIGAFEDEAIVMIESSEEVQAAVVNHSSGIKPENEGQFEHLLEPLA